MTPEEAATWARIAADPLPMSGGTTLAAALAEDSALRGRQLDQAMLGYRQFLLMAAHPGPGPVGYAVPGPTIAGIWTRHRADPAAWNHCCRSLLGRMPQESPADLPLARDPAYAATLARHEALFAAPPHPKLWPSLRRLRLLGVLDWLTWRGIIAISIGMAAVIGLAISTPGDWRKPVFASGILLVICGFFVAFTSVILSAIIGPWAALRDDSGGGGMDGGGD